MPTVVLGEDTAIKAAGKIFADTPASTWQDYLAFHFVSDHAQFLPKAFDEAKFDFYSRHPARCADPARPLEARRRAGQRRARRGGRRRSIVERHYPPESSRQMGELIANIRARAGGEDRQFDWMDDATRAEALAKLDAFDPRTGHPAKYIDYSTLRVERGDLLGNALRSGEFDWDLQLSRFNRPVDRSLWGMLPQTNNAYYDPTTNQITFPAGILQPPYFDPNADPAANYGSIGATIGHEIGHGFDDRAGSSTARACCATGGPRKPPPNIMSRPTGWSRNMTATSRSRACKIKGQLTLGENLGDLGGLEIAYAAYRQYVAEHGEPPVIDGLTGDQRFFIAYGYSWQTKYREGALRGRLLDRPALARQISRQRRRPQHGRLVPRVRRQARRRALPAARTARPRLVSS